MFIRNPFFPFGGGSGPGGSGGSSTLSGWTFGGGTVLGDGGSSFTFEEAIFLGITPSDTLKVKGSFELNNQGTNSYISTNGVLNFVTLATAPDGNGTDGQIVWHHTGTITGMTASVASTYTSTVDVTLVGQTASFTLSLGTGGTSSFSLTASTLPAFVFAPALGSGAVVTLNAPLTTAAVNTLLQACLDASMSGVSLILGGTSAAPTATPEKDTLTVTGYANGDTVQFTAQSAGVAMTYDDTVDFADSHIDNIGTEQYQAIIGTQDTPTLAQVADLVGQYCTYPTDAVSSVAVGNVATLTISRKEYWGANVVSEQINFANTQTGIDRVSQLVINGNSITTN